MFEGVDDLPLRIFILIENNSEKPTPPQATQLRKLTLTALRRLLVRGQCFAVPSGLSSNG